MADDAAREEIWTVIRTTKGARLLSAKGVMISGRVRLDHDADGRAPLGFEGSIDVADASFTPEAAIAAWRDQCDRGVEFARTCLELALERQAAKIER